MKHAAAKEKPARKTAKIEPKVTVESIEKPVEKEKKVAKDAKVLPFKETKTKALKVVEPIAEETSGKKKIVKAAAGESKIKAATVASAVVIAEKTEKKKRVAPVSIEKSPAKKEKKSASAGVAPKLQIEKKTSETKVVVVENKPAKKSIKENKPAVKSVVSLKPIQNIKPQTSNRAAAELPVKVLPEAQKIKSAVNIGRINAALKAIEAAQAKAIEVEKVDKKRSRATAKKLKIAEEIAAATAAAEKTKPKNTKPIGAAVFRGKKTRYDFQVYPLDFEFENVPGIYVISRRKTDHKKRGHHALVCIGQTESISGELKKHTQGKCVKKHEANAVSILPEPNEKKRLKIEEDLKAAHSIACNLALD